MVSLCKRTICPVYLNTLNVYSYMLRFSISIKQTTRLLGAACVTVSLYACLTNPKTVSQTGGATTVATAPAPLAPAAPKRILVFSKTKGWKHTSIPFGIAALQKLGRENEFRVDTTKNADYFTDDSLKHYQAVVLLSTTGNVLNQKQQAAFERYIQAGGGYMGIHAAADTEYDWPWYNKLAGAYFASHPSKSNVRKATVDVTDKNHPSTAHLPDHWERTDEWYNYRSLIRRPHGGGQSGRKYLRLVVSTAIITPLPGTTSSMGAGPITRAVGMKMPVSANPCSCSICWGH